MPESKKGEEGNLTGPIAQALSIDSGDMADLIRGTPEPKPSSEAEKAPEDEKAEEKRPELQTEREEPRKETTEPSEALEKALRTINALTARVSELEGSLRRESEGRSLARGAASEEELFEVFPGVKLPKDPSKLPLRVTDDDLIRLGWNDEKVGPGRVLSIIGSALVEQLRADFPRLAMAVNEAERTATETATSRKKAFFTAFPDLDGQPEEFLELVERHLYNKGERYRTTEEYNQAVGNAVRERIAKMRGMTIEQYLASVGTQGKTQGGRTTSERRGTSRASTTGGGVRSTTTPPKPGSFEEEAAELMER